MNTTDSVGEESHEKDGSGGHNVAPLLSPLVQTLLSKCYEDSDNMATVVPVVLLLRAELYPITSEYVARLEIVRAVLETMSGGRMVLRGWVTPLDSSSCRRTSLWKHNDNTTFSARYAATAAAIAPCDWLFPYAVAPVPGLAKSGASPLATAQSLREHCRALGSTRCHTRLRFAIRKLLSVVEKRHPLDALNSAARTTRLLTTWPRVAYVCGYETAAALFFNAKDWRAEAKETECARRRRRYRERENNKRRLLGSGNGGHADPLDNNCDSEDHDPDDSDNCWALGVNGCANVWYDKLAADEVRWSLLARQQLVEDRSRLLNDDSYEVVCCSLWRKNHSRLLGAVKRYGALLTTKGKVNFTLIDAEAAAKVVVANPNLTLALQQQKQPPKNRTGIAYFP